MTFDWLYFIFHTLYFHKKLNKSSYSIPNYCPAKVGSATDWRSLLLILMRVQKSLLIWSWEFKSPNIYWYWTTFSMFLSSWFIFCWSVMHDRECAWLSVSSLQSWHLLSCYIVWKLSLKLFSLKLLKLNKILLWALVSWPLVRYSWGFFKVVVSIHFDFFMDTFYTLKLMLG